jgi:hypothetical protein
LRLAHHRRTGRTARLEAADRGETWDELSPAQRDKRAKMATQSPTQKEKGGKDDGGP